MYLKLTPPTLEAVPTKHLSTTSEASPTASNICAPLYDCMVEIPILAITLEIPLSTAEA